jgi:hypothetical protein
MIVVVISSDTNHPTFQEENQKKPKDGNRRRNVSQHLTIFFPFFLPLH